MSKETIQPIEEEKSYNLEAFNSYFSKLLEQQKSSNENKEKILKLLKKKHPQTLVKEEHANIDLKNRKNSRSRKFQAEQLNPKDELVNLSPFYQRYMTGAPVLPQKEQQVKLPSEEQLCQILKLIKERNRKTSIQLMIKMLHEIICPQEGEEQKSQKLLQKETEKSSKSSKSVRQDRFRKYDLRFKEYKERIRLNYMSNPKLQHNQPEVKTQENEPQLSQTFKPIYQKFIQFSTPQHVVEYFHYKNSRVFRRLQERQPYYARQQLLRDFTLKGHALSTYNHERKTAKVFCLAGPGVRAARPFFGQDLGSNTHSKTIDFIVKVAYRSLEQFVNDNIHKFCRQNDQLAQRLTQSRSIVSQETQFPIYYASRRQLSNIKTPLFNCRNWMNEQQLELFFMFVKKSYRIKYPKQWETDRIGEVFLLYGRIIKKLMQKDILMRNLEVLEGKDVVKGPNEEQFFVVSTQNEVIKLSKRDKDKMERQRMRLERQKHKMMRQNQSKAQYRKQLFQKKYQRLSYSFRSKDQMDDNE